MEEKVSQINRHEDSQSKTTVWSYEFQHSVFDIIQERHLGGFPYYDLRELRSTSF